MIDEFGVWSILWLFADDMCDSMETLNASNADDLARLEPLREFTMSHRDLRYDEALQRSALLLLL